MCLLVLGDQFFIVPTELGYNDEQIHKFEK